MARITSGINDIKQDIKNMDTTESMAPVTKKSPRIALGRGQFFGLIFLLLILAGTSGWLGYKELKGDDPAAVVAAENKALVAQVGNLIVLPAEEPTVATVNDLAPLKGQAFFDNAKVGDKVLIFTTARKAILYDPVLNKIVEVAPINIGDQSQTQQPATTEKVDTTTTKDTN